MTRTCLLKIDVRISRIRCHRRWHTDNKICLLKIDVRILRMRCHYRWHTDDKNLLAQNWCKDFTDEVSPPVTHQWQNLLAQNWCKDFTEEVPPPVTHWRLSLKIEVVRQGLIMIFWLGEIVVFFSPHCVWNHENGTNVEVWAQSLIVLFWWLI